MNALLTHALQQQQQQVQKQLQQTTVQLQQQQQEREIAQQLLLQQHEKVDGISESIAVQGGTGDVSTSAVAGGSSVGASHSARTTASVAVRGATTGHVTALGGGLRVGTPAITSPAVKPGGGRLAANGGSGGGGGSAARGVTIQGIGRESGLQGVRLGASVSVGLGGGNIPTASSISGSRGSLINNLASKLSKPNTVLPGEKGVPAGRPRAVGGEVPALPQSVGWTIPAKAPGASLTGSRASAIAAEARGLGSSISSTLEQGGVDSGNNRTPVFAQILANMRKQQKLIAKAAIDGGLGVSSHAPMLLKQRDNFIHTSIPTRSTDPKVSSRTAAKHNSQFAHTLVDHEEAELVDVGRPFQIVELPPHLKEHDYSLYNPEEGEKVTRDKNMRIVSNIPPSRVSYAPQVSPEA